MNPTEKQLVTLTLGGVARQVIVEQFNPGTLWYVTNCSVLCRFPSGSKLHVHRHAAVSNRNGKWVFLYQVVHNRHVVPVRWADEEQGEQHGAWEVQERKNILHGKGD